VKRLAPAFLAGLLAGVLTGWLLFGGSGDSADTGVPRPPGIARRDSARSVAPAVDELERLRAELELERTMRRSLVEHLEVARSRLADRDDATAEPAVEPRPGSAPFAPHEARRGRATTAAAEPAEGGAPWFADDALLELGLDPQEVARLRERWEQYTMDKLEITDQMARGGRPAKLKARRERRDLDAALREDIGDESYDAMLYATNQHNRVILSEVLDSSPAAANGVMPGDELISYAGERIFDPITLKKLTTQGQRGEWVELLVMRNGKIDRTYIQRGPMGVQLMPGRRPPYAR
jgi:hypothetical protein